MSTARGGAVAAVSFVSHVQGGAVSDSPLVQVRAPVSLHGSKASLRNGQRLMLGGRVAGRAHTGLLVELQAARGGRRQTFATTRTGRKGRFHYAYRFRLTRRGHKATVVCLILGGQPG